MRAIEWGIVGFVVAPTTAWMTLAVCCHLRWRWARFAMAAVILLAVGAAWRLLPIPWALTVWAAALGLTFAWWFSLRPRADRDWAAGMERLPRVTIDADRVRISGFRNFDYDVGGLPVPRYEEQNFDLAGLRTVDYFLSHWSGPVMAHTLASFGFDDGRYLAVSVEARRRKWQRYSPLWGLFRSYELMFVIGDERDIVRVRTNVRGERVYLYRVRMPPRQMRLLLLDFLQRAESLATRPEWYNSVVSNCATNLFYHRNRQLRIRWWMKAAIFLNGLSARTLYRLGGLADGLHFKELQTRSEIHEHATAAADLAHFSQRIRAQLVEPRPWTEAAEE